MLGALQALLNEPGPGSQHWPRMLVALGAYSPFASQCKHVHWMADKNVNTETVSIEEEGTGSQVSRNTVASVGITQFDIYLCQEEHPSLKRLSSYSWQL